MTIVIQASSGQRRIAITSLAAIAGLVLSKGPSLSPGFAIDDYGLAQESLDPRHFLEQVRLVGSGFVWALDRLDVTLVSIAWLGTLVSFAGLALVLGLGLHYADPSRSFGLPVTATAAFLVACHPYLTELFTFRQATPLLAVGALLMLLTVVVLQGLTHAYSGRTPWARMLTAALMLTLLGLSGQIPLLLVAFFIVARVLNSAIQSKEPHGFHSALRLNRYAISALLAGGMAYVVVHLMITRVIAVSASDSRASLLRLNQVPQRLQEGFQLLTSVVIGEQPVIPRVLALAMSLLIVLVLLGVLLASRRAAAYLALMLLILALMALAPVLVSGAWWPVPRAMYGLAFATGIVIASASAWLRPMWTKVTVVLTIMVALSFAMQSNAILSDQQRLNRWDLFTAQSIAAALGERGFGPGNQIVVVGFPWAYPAGLTTVQGDMNISAMPVSWSVQPLFREATGADWNVSVRPNDPACERTGTERAFVIVESEPEVVVCYRP